MAARRTGRPLNLPGLHWHTPQNASVAPRYGSGGRVTTRSRCALLTIAATGIGVYTPIQVCYSNFYCYWCEGWCHRVEIDYESGEPVYLQIARLLRDQIIQGELQVGAQLPSGNEMQASRGVTRVTYQHAVDQLRDAGLVVTRAGKGTFVVAVPMLQVVDLSAGDQVAARMPSEAEREQLDTGLSPVLVVTRADGSEEVFSAAVTVCRSGG